MTFAKYLKQLRMNNNLSIRQLALYSNVSAGYLSQIETEVRGVPSPIVLKKLARPLKVSYEELMKAAGYLVSEPSERYSSASRQLNIPDSDLALVKKFTKVLENPLDELFFSYILNLSDQERSTLIEEFLKMKKSINK